jgi:hypothetical protein
MTKDIETLTIPELVEELDTRLKNLPKAEICDYSCLPDKVWCNKGRILVRSYCERCSEYKNEELGINSNKN